jgi:hypothetical protein
MKDIIGAGHLTILKTNIVNFRFLMELIQLILFKEKLQIAIF